MNAELSRRTVLKQLTGVVAGTVLITAGEELLAPRNAQASDGSWRKSTSANGWAVIAADSAGTTSYDIPGTNLRVPLREGDAGTVLSYVAQRFHYDVTELRADRGDIVGYSEAMRLGASFESNHLSGTALALYPQSFPLGVEGNLFPHQIAAIRDILAELQGVIKWGGDMEPAKESTFFVDVPPNSAKLTQVAENVRQWRLTPGKGAGTQNIEAPRRVKAAKKLARLQAA